MVVTRQVSNTDSHHLVRSTHNGPSTNARDVTCTHLVEDFAHEHGVAQSLPSFHYSNDGGIDLVLPVTKHALVCFLTFFRSFFQLHDRGNM